MKNTSRLPYAACALAIVFALGGCANMSTRDRNTVSGAAIGAVAGSVLTGGSPIGTVGGAAVGGVIGNELGRRR
ncbi:MAG: osmotically-inducible lipoprotein OsmB [Burkholderiales bacterium]|nr:osmotically-inducible lipoprotein OsmB [Burkholderiales bacterium]